MRVALGTPSEGCAASGLEPWPLEVDEATLLREEAVHRQRKEARERQAQRALAAKQREALTADQAVARELDRLASGAGAEAAPPRDPTEPLLVARTVHEDGRRYVALRFCVANEVGDDFAFEARKRID